MHVRFKSFGLFAASLSIALCLASSELKSWHLLLAQSIAISQHNSVGVDRLFQQAVEQFRTGQFQAALQTYQQVLSIRKNSNDKAGVAATLNNIGEVYTSLADCDKALSNLQAALTICKELRDGSKA